MSAPDLQSLFAYESAIETAFRSVLQTANIPNVYIEATDLEKVTPYVDLQLRNSLPEGQRFMHAEQIAYYNAWKGTLVTRIVTSRGKNSARQPEHIGRIRVEFQSWRVNITPSILPYHQILLMTEAGMERGIDTEQRLDWTELQYTVAFNIRTDAWPF